MRNLSEEIKMTLPDPTDSDRDIIDYVYHPDPYFDYFLNKVISFKESDHEVISFRKERAYLGRNKYIYYWQRIDNEKDKI